HDDAVAVGQQRHLGQAPVGRGQAFDLGPHVVEGPEPEVAAQAGGQLGGDDPVGAGGARGGDLLVEDADPALDVGGGPALLAGPGGGQHHVGVTARLVEE